MKKKPINTLVEVFRSQLEQAAKNDSFFAIYYQLFSLKDNADLQQELQFNYDTYRTDEYWFGYFHKSIRQCDYFHGCTIDRKYQLISDEEDKRFRTLLKKINTEGYNKKGENGELFNAEYKEYLDLYQRRRRQEKRDSINGRLDSILWNMIHIDEARLEKFLKKVFFEFENQ